LPSPTSILRRAVLGLTGLLLLLAAAVTAAENAIEAIEARMRKDITYLASEECEGRGVDTKGIHKAADYIANEFKKAGLKPITENPGFYQPFFIGGIPKLETPNSLTLRGPQGQELQLELNKQFRPMGLSGSGKLSADVVFVGYGVVGKNIVYDDFKGVHVENKVVIALRKAPRPTNQYTPFDDENLNNQQPLFTKLINAEARKAAAVLIVNDHDTAKNSDTLPDFAYAAGDIGGSGGGGIPALYIKRDIVDRMLHSSLGVGLREIEQDIDRDLKPRSAALTGWKATLEVSVRRQRIEANNVIGVLEGAGPLAKETVVIGAHYDHLGYGSFGSLAKLNKPAIHFGADDNGSGTTALIELARRFGARKDRQGRRLVFMAFSGEEKGLLGSAHYCRNPLIPLTDTVAMVNLDMVGRLRADEKTKQDKLIVYGTGTAKTFDAMLEALNKEYQFQFKKVPGGSGPSDHASFYAVKVPVLFFFTDTHSDYHRPSDTADKINISGMRKITDLVTDVVEKLQSVPERPEYVAIKTQPLPMAKGPRIGIRPDYGADVQGVLVGGVTEGGPADKAGLKAGDVITEVAGKPVRSVEVYTAVMASFKPGDKVELTITRDGKKMTLTVVPQ
jgi:hypothetical protein